MTGSFIKPHYVTALQGIKDGFKRKTEPFVKKPLPRGVINYG